MAIILRTFRLGLKAPAQHEIYAERVALGIRNRSLKIVLHSDRETARSKVFEPTGKKPAIAFFLPSLRGGGVEKVVLNLAAVFQQSGYSVDLVVTRLEGDYLPKVPALIGIRELRPVGRWRSRLQVRKTMEHRWLDSLRPVVVPFKSSRILRYLPALTDYLKCEQPDVLISAMPYPNLVATWARRLAGVTTRVVVSEHNTLSETIRAKSGQWRWRYLPAVIKQGYAEADHIVTVSNGVAQDLAAVTGLARSRMTTIYNPVVSPVLKQQAEAAVDHPWFARDAPPVVLAVGRLSRAKGFDVLIRAFARVKRQRDARLLILGEGRERAALQALTAKLGLDKYVAMPGFSDNPYGYMARASLFAVSSRYEGFSVVLVEAMACGCPLVSSDCPNGPREILNHGEYGHLLPVGDDWALADAIVDFLDQPPDTARQRERAQLFSVERSAAYYQELVNSG